MVDIRGFLTETLELSSGELRSRFGADNNVRAKKDRSLVTDADLASEKIILERLARFFPDDAVISEESGQKNVHRTRGQRVWIIDPLDGTTNFANGFPFFSVSIGYGEFTVDRSVKMLAGGVIDPVHGQCYLAELGQGAFRNNQKICVQEPRSFSRCFLVTGFYYTMGNDLDREIERFRRVAQNCQSIRRDGSAALDLALVAAGVYDGFWERGLAIWDVAAGSLLVQEAGGYVSNYPVEAPISATSAPLAATQRPITYSIEGDGIVAGVRSAVEEIRQRLSPESQTTSP
jgi:myo-inositol-1(or 4)-monophosphatase